MTPPLGPGRPPEACSKPLVASRPRCCAMARCSWRIDGDSAQLYDPASGTWTATGKMVEGLVWRTRATVLRDGKVLVAGLTAPQLYDPASGTWTATGKMITPRLRPRGHLLSDGKVLVAGGSDGRCRRLPDWTRPRSTTPSRGPGPRSRTCTRPGTRIRTATCCPMARCWWYSTTRHRRSTTRPPEPGPHSLCGPSPGQIPGHCCRMAPCCGPSTIARATTRMLVPPRPCTTRAPGRGRPPRACSGAATRTLVHAPARRHGPRGGWQRL